MLIMNLRLNTAMKKNLTILGCLLLFSVVIILLQACDYDMDSIETATTQKIHNRATEVGPSEALYVAETFSGIQNPSRLNGRSGSTINAINDDYGMPLAYVVNLADGGWVMVSATKEYFPIMAYSEDINAHLDINNPETTEILRMWPIEIMSEVMTDNNTENNVEIAHEWQKYEYTIDSYVSGVPGGNSSEAIKCRERLRELNEQYYNDGWSFITLDKVTEVTIPNSVYQNADNYGSPYQYTIVGLKDISTVTEAGPLVETEWHQYDPFNKMCKGYPAPAGCAAIAMIQIMKYHMHPSDITWYKMSTQGASPYTQEIIAQIGEVINVKYDIGGSDAEISNILNGFRHYGYSVEKKSHTNNDVIAEIVSNRRPIYMRAKNTVTNRGHGWVCDGAKKTTSEYEYYVEYLNSTNEYTNYGLTLMENPGLTGGLAPAPQFHMNWGQSDLSINGWYINPKYNDSHDYSKDRENIYVKPDR